MGSITIRNLDDRTKERLRLRAARRRRSMEAEARHILRTVLAQADAPAGDLASLIQRRFEDLGGVELEIPAREPMRPPPVPETRRR